MVIELSKSRQRRVPARAQSPDGAASENQEAAAAASLPALALGKSLPLPEISDRDSYASTALADTIDRSFHAAIARVSRSLSPAAVGQAYLDWWAHLAFSPGKQLQLPEKAAKKAIRFSNHATNAMLSGSETDPCIVPLPQDHRFDAPA